VRGRKFRSSINLRGALKKKRLRTKGRKTRSCCTVRCWKGFNTATNEDTHSKALDTYNSHRLRFWQRTKRVSKLNKYLVIRTKKHSTTWRT